MLERKVRVSEWETSSGRPREQMCPNQMAVRLLPAQDLSEAVGEILSCFSGCTLSSPSSTAEAVRSVQEAATGSLPCQAARDQTLRRAGDTFLRWLSPFCLANVMSGLLPPSPSLQRVPCGSSSDPRALHPSDVTSHRSRLAKALFRKKNPKQPHQIKKPNKPTLAPYCTEVSAQGLLEYSLLLT